MNSVSSGSRTSICFRHQRLLSKISFACLACQRTLKHLRTERPFWCIDFPLPKFDKRRVPLHFSFCRLQTFEVGPRCTLQLVGVMRCWCLCCCQRMLIVGMPKRTLAPRLFSHPHGSTINSPATIAAWPKSSKILFICLPRQNRPCSPVQPVDQLKHWNAGSCCGYP